MAIRQKLAAGQSKTFEPRIGRWHTHFSAWVLLEWKFSSVIGALKKHPLLIVQEPDVHLLNAPRHNIFEATARQRWFFKVKGFFFPNWILNEIGGGSPIFWGVPSIKRQLAVLQNVSHFFLIACWIQKWHRHIMMVFKLHLMLPLMALVMLKDFETKQNLTLKEELFKISKSIFEVIGFA